MCKSILGVIILLLATSGAGVTAAIDNRATGHGTSAIVESTAQPMITIGGQDSDSQSVRMALGPAVDGLRLSLTPTALSAPLKRPMMVSLWLNSVGDRDRLVCFGSFRYHLKFVVTSLNGHEVAQRQPSFHYGSINGFNHCDLEIYKQWRYDLPVNEFTQITQPGTYLVKAGLDIQTDDPAARNLTLQSNTIELTVTP